MIRQRVGPRARLTERGADKGPSLPQQPQALSLNGRGEFVNMRKFSWKLST